LLGAEAVDFLFSVYSWTEKLCLNHDMFGMGKFMPGVTSGQNGAMAQPYGKKG
jgi:hypothetical protein